jgi:hypothetical protein
MNFAGIRCVFSMKEQIRNPLKPGELEPLLRGSHFSDRTIPVLTFSGGKFKVLSRVSIFLHKS